MLFLHFQGLLNKHEVFETDLAVHQGRIKEMEEEGEKLIKQENYQADKISIRLKQLKVITIACEELDYKINSKS